MTGAALTTLAASCARLCYALRSLRLRLWQKVPLPQKRFLRNSLPLFLDTLTRRLHKQTDLWAVQALAGATAAGYYSVALGVNSVSGVLTHALTRLVLATVSGVWGSGNRDVGRAIIRQSLRLALWLVPFAALGAGTARP